MPSAPRSCDAAFRLHMAIAFGARRKCAIYSSGWIGSTDTCRRRARQRLHRDEASLHRGWTDGLPVKAIQPRTGAALALVPMIDRLPPSAASPNNRHTHTDPQNTAKGKSKGRLVVSHRVLPFGLARVIHVGEILGSTVPVAPWGKRLKAQTAHAPSHRLPDGLGSVRHRQQTRSTRPRAEVMQWESARVAPRQEADAYLEWRLTQRAARPFKVTASFSLVFFSTKPRPQSFYPIGIWGAPSAAIGQLSQRAQVAAS
jgi:hypothetical protein